MQVALWLTCGAAAALVMHSVAVAAEATPGAITRLKELHIDTVLAANGQAKAVIVAPADGRYAQAVAILQQAIRGAGGVDLPVIADDAAPEVLLKDRSLIALGNMATSKFIYELYRQYYTWLDLRYPGKNGYAIHSLHNPFATGHNVLLLGGSDDAGVLRAAKRFTETLEPGEPGTPLTVGWRLDVQLGDDVPPPPPPDEKNIQINYAKFTLENLEPESNEANPDNIYGWCDSARFDEDSQLVGRPQLSYAGWNPFSKQAALYYMTGDRRYLDEFLRLAIPDPDNLPEPVTTLYVERSEKGEYDLTRPIAMAHHYTAHRMALMWDLIEESPLLTDEQRLRLTDDLRWNCELSMNYGIGHSRHGAYSSLNIYTISRYMNKYYPEPRWTSLLKLVDDNFAWWTQHSTWGERDQMPWINTCIYPVAMYFTLSGPQRWLDSGVARTLMEGLPAIWSGRPYEKSIEAQPLNLMHMAAWLLRDGRYTYMARAANYDLDRFRIDQSWWPTPDIEAVPPSDLIGRVSVVPLPQPEAVDAGVAFDHREGFHYLTYRTGLDADDGFLMLDGFNGGRRNPHHVAALTYLRAGGRDLLSGYGNQVHILRDGLSDNHVAMGARFDGAFCGEAMAYISTTVPDDAFSSRQRAILWVSDDLVLVIDSLTAREAGNFEIVSQWEPVAALRPAPGSDSRWAQSEGEKPITLVAAQPVQLSNASGPLQHGRALASLIDGLLSDDYVLNQKLKASLSAGDRLTMVSAIYADEAPGRFGYRLEPLSTDAILINGPAVPGQAVAASGPFAGHSLAADAAVSYFSAQRLLAHHGQEMAVGGRALWRADKPVSLAWNLISGTVTVEASEPVTLSLTLAPGARPAVDGQSVSGDSIKLSPGAHQMTGAAASFMEALSEALAGVEACSAPAVTLPSERLQPNWSASWSKSLPGPVRLMKLDPRGDELWIASDAPAAALHRIGLNGEARSVFKVPVPADALAFSQADSGAPGGGVHAIAGGKDNQLRAFNAQGQLLWCVESEVWPGHRVAGEHWDASWYTNPRRITGIRSLLIADLAGAGSPQILVGRPATFEAWTMDGTLIGRQPLRWGDVSTLDLVSYGGERRLLLGNFYTARDRLHTAGADMKIQSHEPARWNYMLPVPPGVTEMSSDLQRGIAALRVADLDEDGDQEVIIARSGQWNDLRAYNTDGTSCLWMHSFGPAAPRIVQEHIGRFVRAMSLGEVDGEPGKTVAIGLANGWAHCFTANGTRLWSHHFPDIVTAMAHVAGHVAVGLRDGSVSLLDRHGHIVRSAILDGEIRSLVGVAEPLLFVGDSTGVVAALAP